MVQNKFLNPITKLKNLKLYNQMVTKILIDFPMENYLRKERRIQSLNLLVMLNLMWKVKELHLIVWTKLLNINLNIILEILKFQFRKIKIKLINNKLKILESICKMIKFMMRKNTWVLKVRVEAVILVKEKRLKHIIQLKKGKILKRIY